MLDPAAVTRTKVLGSERIERKLRDALPGGDGALCAAVWEFMRPMLSPALVERNRHAFVVNESPETTVDLDGHRAASDLDELALDRQRAGRRGSVVPGICRPPDPAIRLWAGGREGGRAGGREGGRAAVGAKNAANAFFACRSIQHVR